MKKLVMTGCCLLLSWGFVACSHTANQGKSPPGAATSAVSDPKTLKIGGISEQDPKPLQQRYDKLAKYLQKELKVSVASKPIKDNATMLADFKGGNLDLAWMSGSSGVRARSQVPGAVAIAQRETDAQSRSVFIANKKSKIPPTINNQKGLAALKGHTFTFGSESSTVSHLMPQYFLEQAGVKLTDLKATVGFAKSQELALEQVQAGTYDAGVVGQETWESHLQTGKTDPDQVVLVWQSPAYPNCHWVLTATVKDRFGNDFVQKVQTALLKLSPSVPEQKEILELFGTEKFIKAENSNYAAIEKIEQEVGPPK